jgi:hypothetical protein
MRLFRAQPRLARSVPLALLSAVLLILTAAGTVTAAGHGVQHRHGKAKPHPSHPPTPPRGHALKMLWGPVTLPNGSSAFPMYHQLGVQVLELQLSWAAVAWRRPANAENPADPSYVWPASLDTAVAEAQRYGIALALMVKETPEWANGGQGPSWAPNEPNDYAAFLQAASRRYPSVHDWMIWGEVTRPGNFNPMPANSPVGPERYALLLEDAYTALKAASSQNTVIGGMTYTLGADSLPQFLHWLRLPDGKPPRMDLYGDNPYSTRYPRAAKPYSANVRDIDDLATIEREVRAVYAGAGMPVPALWLSEFSITSDGPSRAFDYYVSEPVQARWLTAAYKLADSLPYVAGLGWYELLDEPMNVAGRLTEGLLQAGGQPKPAFYAYEHVP